MKILIAGDTHGDYRNVFHKIDKAKAVGNIQRIVIVGDFGLWWGFEAIEFLDKINDYAKENNVQLFALPGNHENMDYWNALVNNAPATAHGWAYVRSHLLLSPRVHQFKWGGKQFVIAGGAVSIDKVQRLAYEAAKGKQVWSPNEQLTDEEVDITWNYGREFKTDYLLTHDCSNRTPFYGRLKPDIDSEIHRKRIDKVLRNVNPRMHFHGHMHTKYDWMNFVGERDGEAVYTQTYGLECNRDFFSWGVLDTEAENPKDEFIFGPEL